MRNPNSLRDQKFESELESLFPNFEDVRPLFRKLGATAESQTFSEKPSHKETEKTLKANNEVSKKLNLESVGSYLESIDMDPKLAETLLDSGAFDLPDTGRNEDYRISLWSEKDENGTPYLRSTIRDQIGHRRWSGHMYKIFEREGLVLVYDSKVKAERKYQGVEEFPKVANLVDHKIESNQFTVINPITGKVVAAGGYSNEVAGAVFDDSVMSVNNENLDERLNKAALKIKSQTKKGR